MSDPINLVLPYPISANRYWRSFVPRGAKRAHVVLSDEARAYKQHVGLLAMQAGLRDPFTCRVELLCRLYPAEPKDAARRAAKLGETWDDGVLCIDLDNALKVTIDALKGTAYDDDKRVWRILAQREEPAGQGRIEVTVTPISSTQL